MYGEDSGDSALRRIGMDLVQGSLLRGPIYWSGPSVDRGNYNELQFSVPAGDDDAGA